MNLDNSNVAAGFPSYDKCSKAMYGSINSAMLWWNKHVCAI